MHSLWVWAVSGSVVGFILGLLGALFVTKIDNYMALKADLRERTALMKRVQEARVKLRSDLQRVDPFDFLERNKLENLLSVSSEIMIDISQGKNIELVAYDVSLLESSAGM